MTKIATKVDSIQYGLLPVKKISVPLNKSNNFIGIWLPQALMSKLKGALYYQQLKGFLKDHIKKAIEEYLYKKEKELKVRFKMVHPGTRMYKVSFKNRKGKK